MAEVDIGLIGLAVMGQNLVLNISDHGFTASVFYLTTSKIHAFMEGSARGTNIIGTHSIEKLISTLKRPRKVILMVKAGTVIDAFIKQLVPLLDKGDL